MSASHPASQPDDRTKSREREPFDLVDGTWRLFSSLHLALGLILGLALLGLIAILVEQAPADLAFGSADYTEWVQSARPVYGAWTDLLAALQLFSATRSVWMHLLLSALAVNTLVCTLNRLPNIWGAAIHPTVLTDDAEFDAAPSVGRIVLDTEPEVAARTLRAVLARRRFRVTTVVGTPGYLCADRNHLSRLGTLATHFAIILFLVGALVTSLAGFRIGGFAVVEGSTRPVGLGTALALRLDSFADEYYPEGPPKDYRSEVVLLDGGVEVARQMVRVNEPLAYGGVRFHQAAFGPAMVLRVEARGGEVVFADGVPLAGTLGGRPFGAVEAPQSGLVIYVVGPGGRDDPALMAGQARVDLVQGGDRLGGGIVAQGQPTSIGGYTVSLVRERQYSSFQIVSDPGAPIIWIASALFVLGISTVFYFPHRRLRARVAGLGDRGSEIVLIEAGARRVAAAEFRAIGEELQSAAVLEAAK